MNQTKLYAILAESHCTVLLFEDHPNFFGNWRALFERKDAHFEVVSDHREGWLTLWQYAKELPNKRIYEVESSKLDETAELLTLQQWLACL